jgi:hypothetical protein
MAGGFKLSLVPDVGPFVAGMAKAEKSLDDTADALDDLARDAQRKGRDAGQDIAKGIDTGADKATDSVDDLTASFADMARAGAKASRETGDDIGKNVKRGTDDAESGLDSFKEEAAGTARETAASFDGSADSIAGSFQEIAANALGGFGPIGAAAGLALAAGIGVFWADHQKNAEKAAEQVETMFDDMISSQQAFLSQSYLEDEYYKIIKGAEDAALSQKELDDVVGATGLTQAQVARLFVQSAETRQQLEDILAEKIEKNRQLSEGAGTAGDAQRRDERASLAGIIDTLDEYGGRISDTSQKYRDAAREAQVFGDDAVGGAERAMAMYDGLGRKIAELPTERTVTVKVTADTTDAVRAIKRFTDGSYAVTVKGRVVGMRME